jgi:hypothetical protein
MWFSHVGRGVSSVRDSETLVQYDLQPDGSILGRERVAIYLTPNPNSKEGEQWFEVRAGGWMTPGTVTALGRGGVLSCVRGDGHGVERLVSVLGVCGADESCVACWGVLLAGQGPGGGAV